MLDTKQDDLALGAKFLALNSKDERREFFLKMDLAVRDRVIQNLQNDIKNVTSRKALKKMLPYYVYAKILADVQVKSNSNEINLCNLFDRPNDKNLKKLEDALKTKLNNVMSKNHSLTLLGAFEEISRSDKGFLRRFIEYLASYIWIIKQEDLLKEIGSVVPVEYLAALEAEKTRIIQDIDLFTEKVKDAQLGRSIHEVKQYTKNEESYFVKGIYNSGFKPMMYGKIIGISNEGLREVIGSAFMHEMGMTSAAQVNLIKDKNGVVNKIASKSVGQAGDKICTLGQYLKGWDFDGGKADTKNPKTLDENLKKQVIEVHAMSYLIGNRDAKNDNIMIVRNEKGELSVALIDFGLSCHDMSSHSLRFSHFNKTHGRHRDSLPLFTQDEYKKGLQEVVNKFESKETIVMHKIKTICDAMKDLGMNKHAKNSLIRNITSNVNRAKEMIGESQQIAR